MEGRDDEGGMGRKADEGRGGLRAGMGRIEGADEVKGRAEGENG